MNPMRQVLEGGGLEISDNTYTLTVKALPRSTRGRRVVRVDVGVQLAWAIPLQIDFYLPDDTDLLRGMLEDLRDQSFGNWLENNGYDRYGKCVSRDCTFGKILTE